MERTKILKKVADCKDNGKEICSLYRFADNDFIAVWSDGQVYHLKDVVSAYDFAIFVCQRYTPKVWEDVVINFDVNLFPIGCPSGFFGLCG